MMDQLMTLEQMTTQTQWTMSKLCEGTQIDKATQDLLFDWYKYRYVCDNVRFPTYFNRQLRLYQDQYLAQVRLQLVEIDPMVSEYMERQILRSNQSTGEVTGKTSGTRNQTGTGGGTIDTTQDNTTDVTANAAGTTYNVSHESGKDNDTITRKEHVTGKDGAKSLGGNTPDSSLYPDGGFPANLAWRYASNQAESQSTTDRTNDITETDASTYERDANGNQATTDDSTSKSVGHGVGKTTESNNTSLDETTSGTTSETTSGTQEDDMRERYTGRHEAPQDMLDRARQYIRQTNAFAWLLDRLDNVFMMVYDV